MGLLVLHPVQFTYKFSSSALTFSVEENRQAEKQYVEKLVSMETAFFPFPN